MDNTDSDSQEQRQFFSFTESLFVLKRQTSSSSSSCSSLLFPDLSYLETFYFQNIIYKNFSFSDEHSRNYLQTFRKHRKKNVHFDSSQKKRKKTQELPAEITAFLVSSEDSRQEILQLELKGLNKITEVPLSINTAIDSSIRIYDYLYNHRHLVMMTQHFTAFYFEIYQNIVDLLLTVEERSPYTQKVLTFFTNMFHTTWGSVKEFVEKCTKSNQSSWVIYKIILHPQKFQAISFVL